MTKISKNNRIKMITKDGKRHMRIAKRVIRTDKDVFVIDDTGNIGKAGFSPGEGEVVHELSTYDELHWLTSSLFLHVSELNTRIQTEERLEKLKQEVSRLNDVEIPSRKERVRSLLEEARIAKLDLKKVQKEVAQNRKMIDSATRISSSISQLMGAVSDMDRLKN